ncbi:PA2169 family four-helix-bundle protein [Actimicrobium antarcticum]
MDEQALLAMLHDLIETSRDGEAGFRSCSEEAMGLQLKSAFTCRSQRCAAAARELTALLHTLGDDSAANGTCTLHRRWIDIRSIILNKDNSVVLIQCERGEAMALNSYRNALDAELPAAVRKVLERQYQDVLQHDGQIKFLRDQMRSYG